MGKTGSKSFKKIFSKDSDFINTTMTKAELRPRIMMTVLLILLTMMMMMMMMMMMQVIAAEGEQNASQALREAANVIAESPSAMQVRKCCLVWFYCFIFVATLPTDPQHHLCGAQLHHHLPHTHQQHAGPEYDGQE